mgnify:CR=1 FL=1
MNDKSDVNNKKETSSFFITNIVLTTRVKKLMEENRDLQAKLALYEAS